MDQVTLYSESHELQKSDACYVLENYFRLVKWGKDVESMVLDVGCGDGDVTVELLLPLLPKNFKRLVATDISEDMISFAKSRCKHPRVTFAKLDICVKEIPAFYEEAFDHIFSFYCLHWVQNQRAALKNLYSLLKPGGDMLLTFLSGHPLFTVYEKMSQNPKWKIPMQNFRKYMSPFQHSKNPEKDLDNMLSEAGFTSRFCRVEDRKFTYKDVNTLKRSVAAVSPFISKIHDEERKDYFSDFLAEASELEDVEIEKNTNNNQDKVHLRYKLVVLFACKPL